MIRKLLFAVPFVVVLLPGPASADAISPIWDVDECEMEEEGSACEPEGGGKGTCVATTCSREDLGLDPVPWSTKDEECLKCEVVSDAPKAPPEAPAEPVEPVEPVEPGEPAEPVEPVEPSTNSAPVAAPATTTAGDRSGQSAVPPAPNEPAAKPFRVCGAVLRIVGRKSRLRPAAAVLGHRPTPRLVRRTQ